MNGTLPLLRRMRSAITAISDPRFPFPGSISFFEGHGEEIALHLDNNPGDQTAEALLAWFYRLKDARLTHHHSDRARMFVTVAGSYFAVPLRFRVTVAFRDPAHISLLCTEHVDTDVAGHGVVSVHRLRQVQMLQRSGDAE